VYANVYYVVTPFSNWVDVSTHYFMGSQRVASEVRGYATEPIHLPDPDPAQKTNTTSLYPSTGNYATASAWENFEYVVSEFGFLPDQAFWNAVLNPNLAYAESMDQSTYPLLVEQCEQIVNPPENVCLCEASPYWACLKLG